MSETNTFELDEKQIEKLKKGKKIKTSVRSLYAATWVDDTIEVCNNNLFGKAKIVKIEVTISDFESNKK